MRNGGIACVTMLLAVTLCSGVLVMAGPAGQSRVVDPPMEQAQQIYIRETDENETTKPIIASHYTAQQPAIGNPILHWNRIDGAVMYDIQVLKKHETADDRHSYYEPMVPIRRSYSTHCELEIPENLEDNHFYWRVRPMNLWGKPIGPFSDVEICYVAVNTTEEIQVRKPTIVNQYNQGNGQVLLYPVYDWVAVPGADHYEVEVLDELPENPNGIEPSIHRIDVYYPPYAQQYDQKPRLGKKPFYWRVRALDRDDNPIGVYSDVQAYRTNPDEPYDVAIFGDSISHGGGSVSYSPTDWEFSYASYLHFPTVNVAQSGDTSAMSAVRFERDVLPFHPKYVLILMGSNSLRGGVSAADVIADMKDVKKKCLKAGIKPVFLTIPPIKPDNISAAFDQSTALGWREAIDEVNSYIRGEVHIDITQDMADENGELRDDLAVDGLHLDPLGKAMMAERIEEAWPFILTLSSDAWEET